MKILVVDDDDLVRAMLRSALEAEGYEVLMAPDGDKAMKILAADKIDVMVTDIIMPFKEGMETIIECRRQWEDVRIIAMSGGGRAAFGEFLEMAQKFGADRILKKPFEPDELIAAIKDLAG